MAYDPGAIDATLAAAIGDDAALAAELRLAFVEGVERSIAELRAAREAEIWQRAALRLKGLAASFGALRLMALAEDAAHAVPGDRAVIGQLARAATRL